MITHIVFFRLKDSSEQGLAKTKAVLQNMEGKIAELQFIEVGVNVVASPRNYDLALVTKFASLTDLDAYQVHPAHVEVLGYMKEALREPSVAIDYEA